MTESFDRNVLTGFPFETTFWKIGWGLGAGGWGLGAGGGLGFRGIDFGFCDWNLVLGWVGLEIDGLGSSMEAMTSNFYLILS